MKIFQNIQEIRNAINSYKTQGLKIGFVPTMGAIHEGHLSLVRQVKQHCDIVVVSIFVNQKQFNNNQDYLNYPNNIESDIQKLESEKVDILFSPQAGEIYQDNFLTSISIAKLTEHLCGKSRKGHFEGVALIVAKLFNIVNPDIAIFGEKDFQQLQVIRKLVSDLNINVKIISTKIIRENSGLALSSRNLRLDKKSQKIAPQIYQILLLIKKQILSQPQNIKEILNNFGQKISADKIGEIDYLEICDEENLQPLTIFNPQIKSRIFIAIYLGQIRLIDNLEL